MRFAFLSVSYVAALLQPQLCSVSAFGLTKLQSRFSDPIICPQALRKGFEKSSLPFLGPEGLWKHATKEGDEAAPQKACKGWRFIRPASPGYQEMSLEDKMAAFQKRGNQDVQVFLDSLTKHQREALRQRFSSARQSLKDKDADQLIEM